MKNRRILSNLLILFIGVVAGIVISLSIGAYLNYIDPYTLLRGHPKKFGDIRILAFTPDDVEVDEDIGEVLMMTKNNAPFFYAHTDKSGRVTNIAIVAERDIIRFTMTASDKLGKWKNAMYACDKHGDYTVGEKYIDINFDGQFDTKHVFDDTGEKVSSYIYTDGVWKQIDRGDLTSAVSGQTMYIFDPNSGWRVTNDGGKETSGIQN